MNENRKALKALKSKTKEIVREIETLRSINQQEYERSGGNASASHSAFQLMFEVDARLIWIRHAVGNLSTFVEDRT